MKKYLESYSNRKVIIEIFNLHLTCYQFAAIFLCPSNWNQNQNWPMDYEEDESTHVDEIEDKEDNKNEDEADNEDED